MSETTTSTTPTSMPRTAGSPQLEPLGYDTRGRDPWLAVIRFALLLGVVWGSLLLLDFAGFLLGLREQGSNLAVQFILDTYSAVNAAGEVGCLIFGGLLFVAAIECLKLRRRARRTFVVCVVGGFLSVVANDVQDWWHVISAWWYAIAQQGRTPSIWWTIQSFLRPLHLALIPATLVYLMTRKAIVQRFD